MIPNSPASFVSAALLFLSPAIAAQSGVAVFENVSGTTGNVRSYDELTGAPLGGPPELVGIRLLAIDFSDRSTLTEFLPGRPRLRDDIPGAARIVLQKNRGSLYRYARPNPPSGDVFGFFRIEADGTAQPLLEIPGIGPGGTGDPFVPKVAIARTGDAFLCATKPAAGGNLLEVRLGATPVILDRTASLPPQRFSGSGLALLPTFGVGVAARGILRFDRAGAADAAVVSTAPDPVPAFYTGQLVASRNGQWVATTAGSSASALQVYAVGAVGAARRASALPEIVSTAGMLPDEPTGPHLAISDDGGMCAWRTDRSAPGGGITHECLLGHTQPLPGEQPEQISADQYFLDTLDEVGLFHFRPTGQLLLGVGERAAAPATGLERADLFQVTMPAGGGPPSFVNLTLSSGDATVPFDAAPPTIKVQHVTLLPDESTVLLFDDAGSSGSVLAVRPDQSGAITILPDVKSLDLLEIVGRRILFAVHQRAGSEPEELYRMPTSLGSAPALVDSKPFGTLFVHPTARRDSWVSYASSDLSGELLARVQLLSGVEQSYPAAPAVLGPSFGHTLLGSLAFSTDPPGSVPTYRTWPYDGSPSVVLQTPPAPGFLLPGL